MTISYRAPTGLTAAADTAAPFASLTYTLPTGHTTGDLLVCYMALKPFDTVPGTPTDYDPRSGGADGSTANGNGTGSTYAIAFTKEHDGTESNPVSAMPAQYSPSMRGMLALSTSAGTGGGWTLDSTNGSDTTVTGTTFSATGGAILALTAGDHILVIAGGPDNGAVPSAETITVAGCTLDTVVVESDLSTATGNDGWMYVAHAEVLSGTASGAPVTTATVGNGDSSGQVVFLLIREPVDNDRTGTVTGLAPATSGTVTGKAARKGTVTGLAPATSGTITDTAQRFGAVTGTATASGTVTGTKQEANNDATGTVTGSATASGTVAGTKKSTGTVAGSATASGTVTGSENSSTTVTGNVTATGTATGTAARAGAPTGTATATGTATGTKATTGTAEGSATATGTVTGTAEDPDAPVVVEPESTGGGKGYPAPRQQKPAPKPIIRKSGAAHGSARVTGTARGTKGTRSTLCATTEVRAVTYGTKATTTRVLARTTIRSHAAGLRRMGTPAEQERRRRDEDDLLLLIEETP